MQREVVNPSRRVGSCTCKATLSAATNVNLRCPCWWFSFNSKFYEVFSGRTNIRMRLLKMLKRTEIIVSITLHQTTKVIMGPYITQLSEVAMPRVAEHATWVKIRRLKMSLSVRCVSELAMSASFALR